MRTHNTRLWKTLLGSLVVSCLACGGGQGGGYGGSHDGGGLDGAAAATDLGPTSTDLGMPSIDRAPAKTDQAPALDQAPAVDQGTPKLDGSADAEVGAPDVAADLPMQPDLPPTADVFVKNDLPATADLPPTPDLLVNQDLPPKLDVANLDLPPALDVTPAVDLPGAPDAPPALDTAAGIDSPAGETAIDTAPQILWPDKLVYSPGEQLTATFTNGSTNTGAWIGIFPVGTANTAYRDWDYTGGDTSGAVVLHVPATPGTYELRMFQDSAYTVIATSVPFIVAS